MDGSGRGTNIVGVRSMVKDKWRKQEAGQTYRPWESGGRKRRRKKIENSTVRGWWKNCR